MAIVDTDTIDTSSINCEQNMITQNRIRQLRAEAVANLPFLREAPFPSYDSREPYIPLSRLSEIERKTKYGEQIFNRVYDYLRILAAKELYVRGSLLNQVYVDIKNGQLASIQLLATFIGKNKPHIEVIKELVSFTFVSSSIPVTGNIDDFLFPPNASMPWEQLLLTDVALVVNSIDDIDLFSNPSKTFICDGQVLGTQLIFEAKYEKYKDENDLDLWVILSRFVNEHRAVNNLKLLPVWLDKYVRYEKPVELNEVFSGLCLCQYPIHMLRIVLGMSPTAVKCGYSKRIPNDVQDAGQKMCSWYQSRLIQLGFLCIQFVVPKAKEKQTIEIDGVNIRCPARRELLEQLLDMFE